MTPCRPSPIGGAGLAAKSAKRRSPRHAIPRSRQDERQNEEHPPRVRRASRMPWCRPISPTGLTQRASGSRGRAVPTRTMSTPPSPRTGTMDALAERARRRRELPDESGGRAGRPNPAHAPDHHHHEGLDDDRGVMTVVRRDAAPGARRPVPRGRSRGRDAVNRCRWSTPSAATIRVLGRRPDEDTQRVRWREARDRGRQGAEDDDARSVGGKSWPRWGGTRRDRARRRTAPAPVRCCIRCAADIGDGRGASSDASRAPELYQLL